MIHMLTFTQPDGTTFQRLTDNPNHRFVGLNIINEEVPDWVGKTRTGKLSVSAKGAKLSALSRRTGGYCTEDGVVNVTTTTKVLEASTMEPAPLFSGVVEHNTWEGESWFWAFPNTEKVNQALKTLEALYRDARIVVNQFEHCTSNIGRASCKYTFVYGTSEMREYMPKITRANYDLAGRYSQRAKGLGGGYLGGWNDVAVSEEDALTLIEKAISDFTTESKAIYKGMPFRD